MRPHVLHQMIRAVNVVDKCPYLSKLKENVMNPYVVEMLARERQRELDEDLRRIHLARAARKPGCNIVKKFISGFWSILFPKQSSIQNHYRQNISNGF